MLPQLRQANNVCFAHETELKRARYVIYWPNLLGQDGWTSKLFVAVFMDHKAGQYMQLSWPASLFDKGYIKCGYIIYRMAFSYVEKHRIPSAKESLISSARVGNHKSFLLSVRMASHIIFFNRVTGALLFHPFIHFQPFSNSGYHWIA